MLYNISLHVNSSTLSNHYSKNASPTHTFWNKTTRTKPSQLHMDPQIPNVDVVPLKIPELHQLWPLKRRLVLKTSVVDQISQKEKRMHFACFCFCCWKPTSSEIDVFYSCLRGMQPDFFRFGFFRWMGWNNEISAGFAFWKSRTQRIPHCELCINAWRQESKLVISWVQWIVVLGDPPESFHFRTEPWI